MESNSLLECIQTRERPSNAKSSHPEYYQKSTNHYLTQSASLVSLIQRYSSQWVTKGHCSPASSSFAQPVANDGVDPMVGGTETTQLHALAILNLLGIRVSPLDGDV